MATQDGPSLENRRKTNAGPKPPDDFGRDSAEVSTAASSAAAQKSTPKPVYVVQLNTRVAHPYKEMLQTLSKDQGTTIRQLIEQALDQAYGKPEGM